VPSSGPFPRVDARVARRRFERAAGTYATASRLEEEVGARMLERLDYVRIAPRRVLDAGSGDGRDARKLHARYRSAELIRLDFSLPLLRRGRTRFFERKRAVCGDLARLPFADGALDFVWCNMALHWVADPPAVLRELARVLAPEGLLMFSTLGPDTLRELRAAAGTTRVHEFTDMHDLGDMLVAGGLSAPVMDMEMLKLSYREGGGLLADLRGSGQTNAREDRPRGMAGKGLLRKLGAMKGDATFEVVYGHAWKGAPRKLADGREVLRFHSAKGGPSP
jgi:malonyl-CoA O-methyltransferase